MVEIFHNKSTLFQQPHISQAKITTKPPQDHLWLNGSLYGRILLFDVERYRLYF